VITAASLPIAVRRAESTVMAATTELDGDGVPVSDGMSLADQERRLLVQALAKTGGNQTQAARILRITRDTLRYKMKKFNLR